VPRVFDTRPAVPSCLLRLLQSELGDLHSHLLASKPRLAVVFLVSVREKERKKLYFGGPIAIRLKLILTTPPSTIHPYPVATFVVRENHGHTT
jgi:hypothetical protein